MMRPSPFAGSASITKNTKENSQVRRTRRLRHPSCGVRVGEASHPGPAWPGAARLAADVLSHHSGLAPEHLGREAFGPNFGPQTFGLGPQVVEAASGERPALH